MNNSYVYPLDSKKVGVDINGKNILITGGTGSFGKKMIKILLKNFNPNKIVVLSRDEYKQYLMRKIFGNDKIRFFFADIRDYNRLQDAFRDIDVIFHAAALKQVPATEYNPIEAIKTNIYGSENVIRAAIFNNVKKVIAISTDKCVNPINLYGATKLCSERLFSNANIMSGNNGTIFSVLRYGNVLCSRGSVVPVFINQKGSGVLTITDSKMTRFTITLQDAIHFVLFSMSIMLGGEVFVPKLPSYNIIQLADVIAPGCEKKIIGIRPGEKLHEKMISEDESYNTLKCDNFYVIKPFSGEYFSQKYDGYYKDNYSAEKVPDDYSYTSGENNVIDNKLLDTMIKNSNLS